MARSTKIQKTQETKEVVETPIVEPTMTEETLEQTAINAAHVETQPEHPVLAIPSTVPAVVEAKPKAKRYASIAVLANPNAKIATLTPIAQTGKKEGTLTYRKYSLFQVGLSIKEVEAKFVENNWPRMKARNQLRWDIEHGFVTLEMPEATPAVEPAKEA